MTTLANHPLETPPETRAGGPIRATGGLPRWRSGLNWLLRHDGVLAFLVYLAVAFIWNRAVLAHPIANCACGTAVDPGDNADFVWWFGWFVHALEHGQSLLHPSVIWAPTGTDMAGTTASLMLGLIAAPFTLLWGPIVAYNVMMIAAPVCSAWAANRLCREITGSAWPSLIAGATYGFSSYEIGQLAGHLQVSMAVGPPLAALCVIRLLKGSVSTRRFLVSMSLILIAQLFISVEVTFTMTVVGIVALAGAWFTGLLPRTRRTLDRFGVILIPFLITAAATSWYTVQVLGAPAYATGEGALYPTDLLSLFIPLPYTWLGGARLYGVSRLFPGGWDETGAYLGLPLILIMAGYLRARWREPATKTLAIVLTVVTFWILGPTLFVAGKATVPLPYAVLDRLPLLSETLQGRVAMYLALVGAVVLALWLTKFGRRGVGAWALGLLALVSVLPNLADPGFHNAGTWTNPRFFRTTMYQRYIKPGATVLPILWGPNGESFMWQAEDHMNWSMANGEWVLVPIAGWQSPITNDLWNNRPRAGDGPRLKAFIIRRDVSDVVIQDRDTANASSKPWRRIADEAGLRVTADVGGVTVYRVPSGWLKRASV